MDAAAAEVAAAFAVANCPDGKKGEEAEEEDDDDLMSKEAVLEC